MALPPALASAVGRFGGDDGDRAGTRRLQTMSRVFLIVNVAGLIVLLVSIVLAFRRPGDRGFIPGLLLIGVGAVGFTLHELHIFPRAWSSIARFPFLGVAIVGLVLLERERVRKSKSSSEDRLS